jgi:hypothetical protein
MLLYELISEKEEGKEGKKKLVRLYRNTRTGTEVKTEHIYTGNEGEKYFGFVDLYKIPYIRSVYAKHINDMYGIGLSLKDITTWCEKEKQLLKGDDPEKYEKLYALVLEKENIVNYSADPIRQHLALCTVYVLTEEEKIDFFSEAIAEDKLRVWNKDTEAAGFFLNWHHEHIQRFTTDLQKTIKTVSKAMANAKPA